MHIVESFQKVTRLLQARGETIELSWSFHHPFTEYPLWLDLNI